MDKQLTLEEALSRIVESYKPSQKKPFRYSIPAYIGSQQFKLDYERMITPREDMFKFHTYHTEDNGEIGHMYFCRTCHEITDYRHTKKGLEYEGKVIFFTNDDIESLKQKRGLLITNFVYDKPLRPETIKDSYALSPHLDKNEDETAWNKALYDVVLDWTRKERKNLLVVAKISSVGFKSGPDIGVLSYNPERNRIMLNTIYYADEINDTLPYTEGEYDRTKLDAVERKLLGSAKPLTGEVKSPQIREILDIIYGKKKIEQKEENTKKSNSILDRLL